MNTRDLGMFGRPDRWPDRRPLVNVLAWSLMPNHFHLVLRELVEGGIAKFMQQLCGSMSMHFNKKYSGSGSIFQGSYKARTANVRGDAYLKLLAVYVMVKNPFELYDGGLKRAIQDFENAYAWASNYPYCSLGTYGGCDNSPVIVKDIFGELFTTSEAFKNFVRDSMQSKLDRIIALETDLAG